MPRPIDSLGLFHAHALNIEREAMDRYGEFRDYFSEHGEEADHARWVMNALQYREPALDWERMIEAGHGPGTVTGG